MKSVRCEREDEALRCAVDGQWPEQCSVSLRTHIDGCASCSDLVAVATAINIDAAAMQREATVAGSGVAWWRMQRRMQQEAQRTVTRTVTFVHVATLAATACFVLLVFGGLAITRHDSAQWLIGARHTVYELLASPMATSWALPLTVAMAACLLLAPFAVYYALTDE